MKKIIKDGVPVGNWEDKYHSKNPIVKYLMNGFKRSIADLLIDKKDSINSVLECGCGEGEITRYVHFLLNKPKTSAFDFSEEMVNTANNNNKDTDICFFEKNIYELTNDNPTELVVCCEVLEHLEDYNLALKKMKEFNAKYYLFSVPNEPIWRVLNFCRGKYITSFGNTPGHINHWGKTEFIKLVENSGFNIQGLRSPFPWTMLLLTR